MSIVRKLIPRSLQKYYFHYKDLFDYGPVYLSISFKGKNEKNKVVFYPNLPGPRHVLGRIFRILKYDITNDINAAQEAKFIVNWEDTTFRTVYPQLLNLSATREIINIDCKDISKEHVDDTFGKVFGYKTIIDPTTFHGKCVKKGNINALHDGTIVNCPIEKPEAGFIYQKLINNQVNHQFIEDIRTPIFKNTIPFVYVKNRPVERRFASQNHKCVIADVKQVFSKEEIKNITAFCEQMGLDYGELDILRDRDNGNIYIVDVNNTPGGPPNSLSRIKMYQALRKLTVAFIENFIERDSKPGSKRTVANSSVDEMKQTSSIGDMKQTSKSSTI